jgi:predicted house-cleaning NTP pyrophosphatase (Maf/HAM1 superfamily)
MEQADILALATAAASGRAGKGVTGASPTASVRGLGELSRDGGGGDEQRRLLRMPDLVVSADTVVESPTGEILEKPEDGPEAHAAMLRSLSGAAHRVHTGVALVLPSPGGRASADLARQLAATPAPPAEDEPEPAPGSTGPCLKGTVLTPEGWLVRTFAVTTRVRFAPLSEAAIAAYVASGEGDGKAGGYGIQNSASAFVSELVGDYFSVVGFPLHAFSVELAELIEGRLLELVGDDREGEEGAVAAAAKAAVAS